MELTVSSVPRCHWPDIPRTIDQQSILFDFDSQTDVVWITGRLHDGCRLYKMPHSGAVNRLCLYNLNWRGIHFVTQIRLFYHWLINICRIVNFSTKGPRGIELISTVPRQSLVSTQVNIRIPETGVRQIDWCALCLNFCSDKPAIGWKRVNITSAHDQIPQKKFRNAGCTFSR